MPHVVLRVLSIGALCPCWRRTMGAGPRCGLGWSPWSHVGLDDKRGNVLMFKTGVEFFNLFKRNKGYFGRNDSLSYYCIKSQKQECISAGCVAPACRSYPAPLVRVRGWVVGTHNPRHIPPWTYQPTPGTTPTEGTWDQRYPPQKEMGPGIYLPPPTEEHDWVMPLKTLPSCNNCCGCDNFELQWQWLGVLMV